MTLKIVSLTINPALDVNTTTEQMVAEQKIRCTAPRFDPGGGGVNVSRAIKHLGGDSLAVYPSGGAAGQAFQSLLTEEGIDQHPYDFLSASTVPIASKVGAGDSMVAGIVLGLSRGLPLIDAVRYGVAAGTAAVVTSNTELCQKDDAEKLYQEVTIRFGNTWKES